MFLCSEVVGKVLKETSMSQDSRERREAWGKVIRLGREDIKRVFLQSLIL